MIGGWRTPEPDQSHFYFMPNHIKNVIELKGSIDDIESLINEFSTNEHFPDFEKIIPPPDHPAYRDEPTQEKAKESDKWWYHWNIENWGSKWNSYSCKVLSINKFEFETAWSSVPDIINAMSLKYPLVTIDYKYSDEDTGSNCGHFVYCNGLIIEDIKENQSKEAYELAFELRPEHRENYILTDDGYSYKDE